MLTGTTDNLLNSRLKSMSPCRHQFNVKSFKLVYAVFQCAFHLFRDVVKLQRETRQC